MPRGKVRENLNVVLVLSATGQERYQCVGCGAAFSLHGLRSHQSGRFVSLSCKPIWKAISGESD